MYWNNNNWKVCRKMFLFDLFLLPGSDYRRGHDFEVCYFKLEAFTSVKRDLYAGYWIKKLKSTVLRLPTSAQDDWSTWSLLGQFDLEFSFSTWIAMNFPWHIYSRFWTTDADLTPDLSNVLLITIFLFYNMHTINRRIWILTAKIYGTLT
jgi:hypothetical protein